MVWLFIQNTRTHFVQKKTYIYTRIDAKHVKWTADSQMCTQKNKQNISFEWI